MKNSIKVKNIISSALIKLGRKELSDSLLKGAILTKEESDTIDILLHCFNATEDELARKYTPLVYVEDLTSLSGNYYYETLLNDPIRIKSITSQGKSINYTLYPTVIKTDCNRITVEYEYAPSKKNIGDTSDFGNEISENLLVLGVISEYCLINGEIEIADIWDEKYRAEIEKAQRQLPPCKHIEPRDWL